MELVYTLDSGEEKSWVLDPNDLDLEEVQLLEEYSGKTFEEIADAFTRRRKPLGLIRPFLFIYLRRENPDIKYKDVKPKLRQLDVRPTLGELQALYDAVKADKSYPARQEMLDELRAQIAEAKARGASGKEASGQTPASSSTEV